MSRKIIRASRFTKLVIRNWMNFRDAEVNLAARAFFVGPNASGKSNLLDVFRFLSEIAKSGSGGLQAAINARRGLTGVRSLHARGVNSDVEIEAHIGTDEKLDEWIYRLSFNRKNSRENPTIKREEVVHLGEKILDREISNDSEAMSQTYLEQATRNVDFRELAEFFRSCRYLHVVPQVVRDRRRALEKGDDPFGGDLLRRIKDMPKKRRDPRLRLVGDALKIAVPQFESLKLEDDKDGVPHLIVAFRHWRGKAANQTEEAFSDGSLRLIGLLWSLGEGGGPLLLEEPELSLNDAVVSQIPAMFKTMQRLSGRQVIATTHAASLIDAGLGGQEVHIIQVDDNGSFIQTLSDDLQMKSQIENGLTISESVLPVLRPRKIDQLSKIRVAG